MQRSGFGVPVLSDGYAHPLGTRTGTGQFYLQWGGLPVGSVFEDETKKRKAHFVWRSAKATVNSSSDLFASINYADNLYIDIRNAAGTLFDGRVHVEIYGDWIDVEDPPTVGAYGGSLNKLNDTTENPVPFAGMIFRDLQEQRGSAFTTKSTSLVTAENIALARQAAYYAYRLPAQLRNNAVPAKSSGPALEYWREVYALPRKAGETEEAFRIRLGEFAKLSPGATYDYFRTSCQSLLGNAFQAITLQGDDTLSTWSANTFWPMNPGAGTYSIGGGDWYSDRAQVFIDVVQPVGMSSVEFNRLINVDLFDLAQRTLPAWCAPKWRLNGVSNVVWDGFLWDDGTLWDGAFDWG